MTFSVYAAAQARNPLGRPPPEPACFAEAPSEAEAGVEGSSSAKAAQNLGSYQGIALARPKVFDIERPFLGAERRMPSPHAARYRFIRPIRNRTMESTTLSRMELASGK